MSSPCHIELILSEKETPVKKEVFFSLRIWRLSLSSVNKLVLLKMPKLSSFALINSAILEFWQVEEVAAHKSHKKNQARLRSGTTSAANVA